MSSTNKSRPTKPLTTDVFKAVIWQYYYSAGRHTLPWRRQTRPYQIAVSEIMLQQTQVDRVIPKYQAFMQQFPSVASLAQASLGDVLRAWQGLGYNRRAKLLHACAHMLHITRAGRFPQTHEDLVRLPGIGPYTAGAIMAFAYNKPVPIIETNIRAVYLHHWFPGQSDISDQEIMKLVTATLDQDNPREWYWALMDYGSYLKKKYGNPNKRARTYTKQKPFLGSDRQIRGAIIRELSVSSMTQRMLCSTLSDIEPVRISQQLTALIAEQLVIRVGQRYQLPD